MGIKSLFSRIGMVDSDILALQLMCLRGAGAAGSLLVSLLLVSQISMAGFGRWGEVQVAVAMSAMLGALGYEVILFRCLSGNKSPEVLFTVVIPQMVICLVVTGALSVVTLQFSTLSDDAMTSLLVVATAVVQVLITFLATYSQCTGRIVKGQFWLHIRPYLFLLFLIIYLLVFESITVYVVVVLFLFAGLLVLFPLMGSVLADLITAKRRGRYSGIRITDFVALLGELKYLVAGLGSNVVGYLFMRVPVIILTTQGEFEFAGIYLFAAQVSDIARLATSVFYMPFIPTVRAIYEEKGSIAVAESYQPIQCRASVMAVLSTILLPGIAYFLSSRLIGTDDALLVSTVTAIICFGHLCEVILGISGYMLSIFGFARSLCIAWFAGLVGAGLFYFLVAEASVVLRVALAATLGIVLLNVLVWYACKNKLDFNSILKVF